MTALIVTGSIVAGVFVLILIISLICKAIKAAEEREREKYIYTIEPGCCIPKEFRATMAHLGALEYIVEAEVPVMWGLVETTKIIPLKHNWSNKHYHIKSAPGIVHGGYVNIPHDGNWTFMVAGNNTDKEIKVLIKIKAVTDGQNNHNKPWH